jgi:hypothetical protein
MNSRPASKADLTAHGDGLTATSQAGSRSTAPVGLRRASGLFVVVAWAINLGLLLAAFGWIYSFGESRETIELMKRVMTLGDSTSSPAILDPSRLGMGVAVGLVGAAVVFCSCAAMLASLFLGRGRFRTTRTWLVFTAIVCGWLGLIVSWPAVYWFGQQRRVETVLPAAQTLVDSLRGHWPKVESELPALGPFLAYPVSAPAALLPLRNVTFPKTGLQFSAVERSGDEAMRFELAGAETGAWLEWRGDGGEPRAFVGGLDTKYEVAKVARLGPGWFLVRYRAVGLAE